jgi:glycosyltransferase involved in cell wall biosynthesis
MLDSPALDALADRSVIGELVDKTGHIFVQSDTQRALLEAVFPAACNKTSLLPPMIKPVQVDVSWSEVRDESAPVRFVYSGKYSKDWNVEAFFDIPAVCATNDIRATVTMAGDKVHNEKSDTGFRNRILEKLKNTPGVRWLGALDREAAMVASAGHDLGLCWRTEALNDSLEISTKFLEFASVGIPSVVNRTAAYEYLLGEDYPFFAEGMEDVIAAARSVKADPGLHARMRRRCLELAHEFSYAQIAERLRYALLIRERRTPAAVGNKKKVLVATHDPKFLDLALRRLRETGAYDIEHDRWHTTNTHDPARSSALLTDADIIFCEWCTGQAVWYSRHKRLDQKLFVRLHRFEAFRNFPREVVGGALDGVIVVSDYFRNICVKDFGWPADKIIVLPQYCVAEQLRRPKHPGAERTLGFVGINGFHHKRFDRAVDILRQVRRHAPEFRLRIRSAMPWEFTWIWQDNHDERSKFERTFHEIHEDPDLRDAIIFDRPGANMAEWYRNVRFIISTSESEGCHTSVAEGICSGAVPIVIDWPGAKSVYGSDCVYSDVDAMADAILTQYAANESSVEELQQRGAREFDIARTVSQLEHWFG